MNRKVRKLLILTVSLGVLVGGCDAAAHIQQLQPPSVTDPAVTAPAGCTAVSAGKGFSLDCSSSTVNYKRGSFQRGIDIDWYTWKGQDVSADAAWTVRYIVSLHANAVSVSFPFFEDSATSGVHGTSATPSPAELAVVVKDARKAGLYVSLRPLMNNLPGGRSRVNFTPTNVSAWFRSYARFLKPYLVMARRDHVNQFIIGAELSQLGYDKQWTDVTSEARKDYKGQLSCADNWPQVIPEGCGTKLQTVDAYHPQSGNLTKSWERWLATLPHGIVATEVGIAAVKGANTAPWTQNWPGRKLDPAAQAAWFTDACNAAVHEHLDGIYFWYIGLSASPPPAATNTSQTNIGGAGIKAIVACFKKEAR